MSQTLTVHLERPITSVKIRDDYANETGEESKLMQDLESEKAALSRGCQALQAVISKLNQLYDKVHGEARAEIAKLSVEIARKILVKKVEKGDYEIESIVKEALKSAPTRQDVVVHLNPEDLSEIKKLSQDEGGGAFAGVNFVADVNIGRAECLLESPKGIIESFFDKQLEQITKALEKVE